MNPDLPTLLIDSELAHTDSPHELAVAVLRGARAMAVALEDRNEATDAFAAADAAERLELTVRLTASMIRLHDDEVVRLAM